MRTFTIPAIVVLALIVLFVLLGIGMAVFAEEPAPSLKAYLEQDRDIITIPPVIVRPGLNVESCDTDIVVITSPIEACRYVSHTKRIDKKTNRVTVTVRCINDPQETTP